MCEVKAYILISSCVFFARKNALYYMWKMEIITIRNKELGDTLPCPWPTCVHGQPWLPSPSPALSARPRAPSPSCPLFGHWPSPPCPRCGRPWPCALHLPPRASFPPLRMSCPWFPSGCRTPKKVVRNRTCACVSTMSTSDKLKH
jgi:hypothetical protein